MPQIAAAKKALRQNKRRRVVNDRWRVKVRLRLRALQAAITANDPAAARAAIVKTQSVLDRAARRNIINPNKVARQKSRLAKSVAKLTK